MRFPSSPHLSSGILICIFLCTQRCAGQAEAASQTFLLRPEAVSQPTIPMLDEGKGLIHLDVSVTDERGEPVSGLKRQDFVLMDEGRPQKILSFHSFTGQSAPPYHPVQIVLLLDTFDLSIAQASHEEDAVERFLRQNGGHLAQPVSVFGLSNDGLWTVAQHESTDGNSLASDLTHSSRIVLDRHPEPLRALGFIATAQRRKLGRKVLLWIGPCCCTGTGIFPANHTEGQKTFDLIDWFTTLFREARLSIDEISLDQKSASPNEYQQYLGGVRTAQNANQRFLYKTVLAIQSGGAVNGGDDLVAEMDRGVRNARNFYTLSFDPPATALPHEYHRLQVRVNNPGLLVRTNFGYYDEPFYSDQPNPALRPVTVKELGQLLIGGHATGHGDLASRLSHVRLTERANLEELTDWAADHRRASVRQALVAAADASAFLNPPPDIPTLPAPSEAAQQYMLVLVNNYLQRAITELPDFYATRTTVNYVETANLNELDNPVRYESLHAVKTSKATLLYRRGREVVEPQNSEPDDSDTNYLTTNGIFGPLLVYEARQALETPGRTKWLRWESGSEGTRAVFLFGVPAAESKDFEGGCCLPDANGMNSFHIQAGYRGEIAVDPANGAILRLQLQFDVHDFVPMDLDEIEIDYGTVRIGGRAYICPVRSVSLARGRTVISQRERSWDESFRSYGPYSTKMNDMRFSDYHVFRAKTRILPGFTPRQKLP